MNASSERYCSKCGCEIEELERQLVDGSRLRLDEAKSNLAARRFDIAHAALCDIAMATDCRLAEIAEQAKELLASVADEKCRNERERDAACAKAVTACDDGNHQDALQILLQIPKAVRDAHFQSVFSRVSTLLSEIEAFEQSIGDLLNKKNLFRLGDELQRMHSLAPHHAKCHRLAGDLRAKFVASAKRKLQIADYPAALKVLRAVPIFVRDEEWDKLDKMARLNDLLIRDVNGCHVLTENWLGLAQRIVESMPKNEALAARVNEMRQQFRQSGVGAVFSPRGKQPSLQFLQSMPGLQVSDVARPLLTEYSGQFNAAVGVALMHFEDLAEGVNFAPKRKSWNVFQKKAGSQIIGLDIGHAQAKWILLNRNEHVELVDCDVVELKSETEEGRLDEAMHGFAAFVGGHAGIPIALSLSPSVTMIKSLSLPLFDDKKLAAAMELEVPRQFPIDLDELYWGYARSPVGNESMMQTVHCGAVRRRHVDPYLERLKSLKANVNYIQDEARAIGNLVRLGWPQASSENRDRRQWLVIHVGATATHLVYQSPKGLKIKSIPFSARTMNNALTGEFNLTVDQADLVRREPARSKNPAKLLSQFDIVFADLVNDLKRALDIWERESGERVQIETCFLSGGAALTMCVAGRIAQALQLDT